MPEQRNVVIIDIDGTLALSSQDPDEASRLGINYRPWHGATDEQVVADTPNWPIIALVQRIVGIDEFLPVYVTGREERYLPVTERWLTEHHLPMGIAPAMHEIFMRGDGDTRPDVDIKREIHATLVENWKPVIAIDDLKPVVELWRSLGIPTLDVAGNDYPDPNTPDDNPTTGGVDTPEAARKLEPHEVIRRVNETCHPGDPPPDTPDDTPVHACDCDEGYPDSATNMIAEECAAVGRMLVEKNDAYGNSIFDPVRVFSELSVLDQINVRIDDKISRLKRGHAGGEDAELDLIGYLILKRVWKEWEKLRDPAPTDDEDSMGSFA